MVMRVLVKLSVVVKLSARTLGDLVSLLLRLPAYSAGLKVSLQWFPHFARPTAILPPSPLLLHCCSSSRALTILIPILIALPVLSSNNEQSVQRQGWCFRQNYLLVGGFLVLGLVTALIVINNRCLLQPLDVWVQASVMK